MASTTTTASAIVPTETGDLIVQPVIEQSVAMQVATVRRTTTKTLRIPVVTADPTARWVAEGDEITPSDPTLDEIEITAAKVAGLTIISRELADDSSPEAAEVVGEGLARDIARKVDQAFFGNLPSPAPAGLNSLPTTAGNVQTVDAGADWTNLDPFAEALSKAEQVGAVITAWVTTPAVALKLATLKEGTGSNKPLLGNDPGAPTRRQILGLPVFVSPDVVTDTVWGIPEDRAVICIREDAEVESDRSVFFTSDRVAVKATMRVGFGFAHRAALVKISVTPV